MLSLSPCDFLWFWKGQIIFLWIFVVVVAVLLRKPAYHPSFVFDSIHGCFSCMYVPVLLLIYATTPEHPFNSSLFCNPQLGSQSPESLLVVLILWLLALQFSLPLLRAKVFLPRHILWEAIWHFPLSACLFHFPSAGHGTFMSRQGPGVHFLRRLRNTVLPKWTEPSLSTSPCKGIVAHSKGLLECALQVVGIGRPFHSD